MGLMINYDKTEYMETTWKPNKYIRINNSDIERVNHFKYLGSIITNNNILSEISHRINIENKCYYGLRNMLRSSLLKKDTKCKIYKTLLDQWYSMDVRAGLSQKKRKKTYLKERY
jgi:hypothetical protein